MLWGGIEFEGAGRVGIRRQAMNMKEQIQNAKQHASREDAKIGKDLPLGPRIRNVSESGTHKVLCHTPAKCPALTLTAGFSLVSGPPLPFRILASSCCIRRRM